MRPFHLFHLLTAIVVGGCAGIGPAPDHHQASPQQTEYQQAALQHAAALHWTIATAEGRFLGSATALGPSRLLTNRHVVAAAQGAVMIARQGRTVLTVGRQHVSGTDDLAILEVAGVEALPLQFRTEMPASGEWVAVAGATRSGPVLRYGEAVTGAGAVPFGPGRRVAHLPVMPGFSGGPVVDDMGRLVGVVAAAAAASMEDALRLSATRRAGALVRRIALLVPPEVIVKVIADFGLPAAFQPR